MASSKIHCFVILKASPLHSPVRPKEIDVHDQNEAKKRVLKLGPHGHRMETSNECGSDATENHLLRYVSCPAHRDQERLDDVDDANRANVGVYAILERRRAGTETREFLVELPSPKQGTVYAAIASARHKGPRSSAASAPRTARPSAGDTIDRWRAANGHSLESLAYKAGIDISTLWRIRRGKFRYSTHTENLKAVASVIGCDWKDLVQKGTEPSRLPR